MKHEIKTDYIEIVRFWLIIALILIGYGVGFWWLPLKLFTWWNLPYMLFKWWGVIGIHMLAFAAFHCLMVSISGQKEDK